MKKIGLLILAGAIISGCSDSSQVTSDKEVLEEESVNMPEVSKAEKNEYVNDLLDVTAIWISVLEEIEAFSQNHSPYEVREGKPAMNELKTILSRIDNEMVPAFNKLGLPPSKDLEKLYQVESDYVHEAQEIAEQIPMAMSGDPDIKTQFKNRLGNMKGMSNEMTEVIISLDLH